jgi:hypothetical protein
MLVDGRFKKELGGTKNLPLIPAARIISQVKANFLEKSDSRQKFSAFSRARLHIQAGSSLYCI